jgi:nucleoside-diphosphate-sugar epimerase
MTDTDRGPVLITGAAGCIGAWVTAHLMNAGAEVVCLDRVDDRRRLRLILDDEAVAAAPWVVADIADHGSVGKVVEDHGIGVIIHLAALQVPFCKADPLTGASVNVVGHVNVFEAARHNGGLPVVYASSVAALPLDSDPAYPSTLYGVYKAADEGIARIYWRDWSVPSIGLRPHTVYGPGRDQGLTSAPTKAMLSAAAGRPYAIPFTGALLFQFAGEVAEIIARCAAVRIADAHLFDLKGAKVDIPEIVAAIGRVAPGVEITCAGEALPFTSALDDAPLQRLIGDWRSVPLDEGVERSISAFRELLERGLVTPEQT